MNLKSANLTRPAIDRVAFRSSLKARLRLRQALLNQPATINLSVAVYHRPVSNMWLCPLNRVDGQNYRAAIDFVRQATTQAGLTVSQVKLLHHSTGVRTISLRELLYVVAMPWKEYYVSCSLFEVELSLAWPET